MTPENFVLKYLPIVISIFSLILACLSLGWNIYRDLVLKARLKVRFYIATIVARGQQGRSNYLVLTVTNFGPGEITCKTVCCKNRPLFVLTKKEFTQAIIIHNYLNPLSGQLPTKLKVGDTLQLLFPYDKDCFLKEQMTHIGICDSFDREHYAPTKEVKKAKRSFNKDFNLRK